MSGLFERLVAATEGRYRIVRELSQNSLEASYLAVDTGLGREVLIKALLPSHQDQWLIERFLSEARTMASLRHPNIAKIHAVESRGDLPYFVMEYVEGRDLADLVGQIGPIPLDAVGSVLHQVASALAHGHAIGIIHRDLRPTKILIDRQGDAIVTYGVSRSLEPDPLARPTLADNLLYATPEHLLADRFTNATDQYALGAIGYLLLTGRAPYGHLSGFEVAAAILQDRPPPIRARRPDCPAAVEAAILRMLARQPGDRWPTITEAAVAAGGYALERDHPARQYWAAAAQRIPTSMPPLRPPAAGAAARTPARAQWVPKLGWLVPLAIIGAVGWQIRQQRSGVKPAEEAPLDSVAGQATGPSRSDSIPASLDSGSTLPRTGNLRSARRATAARTVIPTAAADRSAEVGWVLERLSKAINDGDTAEVRRIYPGVAAARLEAWRNDTLEQHQTHLEMGEVTVAGEEATARFRFWMRTHTTRPHKAGELVMSSGASGFAEPFTATLLRQRDDWRIVALAEGWAPAGRP